VSAPESQARPRRMSAVAGAGGASRTTRGELDYISRASTAMETAPDRVVFYQLSRKFVHRDHDVPAKSKNLLHYTLAIGHHIGVIDCFSPELEMPIEGYRNWLSHLPKGEAHRKLEGLLRYGEIEISAAHTKLLREALDAGAGAMSATETAWTARVSEILRTIDEEPTIYLMVRRHR
jgi:Formate hydrogenlyase maturation protein HycH